ncbi:MAG: hypothetical protein K1X36_13885 [Pyrinomonadaceae bacterium]|nr:hypothetical protein [Pyrinomonadaceae bacterium]
MVVNITTNLEMSAVEAWQTVRKSSTLVFVTKGLLGFAQDSFPIEWIEGETVKTRLFLFNFIPVWKHQIHFLRVDDKQFELYTNEKGGMISVWNHLIKVESGNDENQRPCLYTDRIEIEAGILTPVVWCFAQIFYRYRQRRLAIYLRAWSEGETTED